MNVTSTNTTSSGVLGVTPASPTKSNASPTSGTDNLANEQTFLKLFMAQLEHQDPEQPQDGTQFLAQLATFSQVEQSLQMREDLDTIKQDLAPAPSATSGSTGTSGTSQTNSQS